jgi:hypothetical protein
VVSCRRGYPHGDCLRDGNANCHRAANSHCDRDRLIIAFGDSRAVLDAGHDANSHGNPDPHAHSNPHRNADAHPDPHSNPDQNANTNADQNADTDTNADTDSDGNAHSNTDAHPNTDEDADPDAHTDTGRGQQGHAPCHPDGGGRAISNRSGGGGERSGRGVPCAGLSLARLFR